MFKDAIDQMKDDEYIDKLHRQINGLKSDIEMVDQQNLSIMKTAEKFKCKSEKLEQQNKRYREALEFYADEDNYKTTGEKTYIGHGDYTEEIWIPVDVDSGKKARQALEGEDQWITF